MRNILAIVGTLVCTGCTMQTMSTEIQMRDTSRIVVRSRDGTVVVPAGRSPSDQVLATGRMDTSGGSSAAYEVHARREGDQSITLEWSTSLPLGTGERHVIVPSSGTIVIPRVGVVTPADFSSGNLVLNWCTSLGAHSYRGVRSYDVDLHGHGRDSCAGNGDVPYTLEIPREDVSVVEHRSVDHRMGWLIVGLSTLSFGVITAFIVSEPASNLHGGDAAKAGLTAMTVGFGAGFDLSVLPTLYTPSSDTTIR